MIRCVWYLVCFICCVLGIGLRFVFGVFGIWCVSYSVCLEFGEFCTLCNGVFRVRACVV